MESLADSSETVVCRFTGGSPKRKVGGSNPPGNANLSGILLADSLWLLAKQPSAFVSSPFQRGLLLFSAHSC